MIETDKFFTEYTSPEAVTKYSRRTAGVGINYLLDHDYKAVYLEALALLPRSSRQKGIRILEFGCGAGMNLLHLVSILSREGIEILSAIGTDFSPILIEEAKREAKEYSPEKERPLVEFCVARNETLVEDLASAFGKTPAQVENTFDFIFGVNTIRYSHRAKKELDCAQGIFDLLAPGGVCAVIDMNDRFPFFRSAWRDRLRIHKVDKQDVYLPNLEGYAAPFDATGFEVLRKEHFCWIPHSSGEIMCRVFSRLSPVFDAVAHSRAMRSLVISRKPLDSRAGNGPTP